MRKIIKSLLAVVLVIAMVVPNITVFAATTSSQYLDINAIEGISIHNDDDVFFVNGKEYRVFEFINNYKNLSVDIVFVDSNNKIINDRSILEKLLYVKFIKDCLHFEGSEICKYSEKIIKDSEIITDLNSNLIEKTITGAITTNVGNIISICSGKGFAGLTDYAKEAGKDSALYLAVVYMLKEVLTEAADSMEELSNLIEKTDVFYRGLSYEDAQKFEQSIKKCVAKLKICDFYISLVSEKMLNNEKNSEVDALDIISNLLDSVKSIFVGNIRFNIENGLINMFGTEFVNKMTQYKKLEDVINKVEDILALSDKYNSYFTAHKIGALEAEHAYIYNLNDVLNDANALIGAPTSPSNNTVGSMTSSSKSTYTTDEKVVITWTKATNATRYGLTIVNNATNEKVVNASNFTGTSYTVGKLPAGTYRFNMCGYNSNGNAGPVSTIKEFTVKEANTSTSSYSTGTYKPSERDGLNMRSGASTSNSIVGAIAYGTSFVVSQVNGNWGKTTCNGKTGWVCLDYATKVSSTITPPSTVTKLSTPTITSKTSFSANENIILEWKTLSGADYYGITVVNNQTGKVVFDDDINNNYIDLGKLSTGKYRWQVRGHNSAGWGNLTNLTYFTVEKTITDYDTNDYAIFPANILGVTQGAYGSFSHNGQYKQNAFDLCNDNKNYFAPFDGTITDIKTSYNAVVLQSDKKVHWADGTYDYMSVCFVHDDDISDLYIGKKIKQGENFYQPGKKAPAGEYCDVHVHLCVNKGQTNAGINIFSGDVYPNKAFFITEDTEISKDGGYTWTKLTIKETESKSFTLTYDANGGTGAPSTQTKNHVEDIKLSTQEPTRKDYIFLGWSTSPDGSVEYGAESNFALNENVTLYAIWQKEENEVYYIIYNANGGQNAPSMQTKNEDEDATISDIVPTREGYTFDGWAIGNDDTVVFSSGDSYKENKTLYLHAVWTANTYNISYNANGGANGPKAQIKTHDKRLVLSETIPVKEGFTFVNWYDGVDVYNPGSIFEKNADTVLSAIWEKEEEFPFVDVPEDAWYKDDVKNAYEKGIVNGKGENRYAPEDNMTYAEAIKIACTIYQLYNDGEVSLKNGNKVWYSTFMEYAIENGIIRSDYSAVADKKITRKDFVNIFYGALPVKQFTKINNVGDNSIPDVKIGDAYSGEIYTFYRAGILTGSDSKGSFMPDSNIKRNEVCAIVTRMLDSGARKSITLN